MSATPSDFSDFCFSPCERCGSDGRLYSYIAPNPRAGRFDPGEEDLGECPVCKGTGLEFVEGEPIDLEDLQ